MLRGKRGIVVSMSIKEGMAQDRFVWKKSTGGSDPIARVPEIPCVFGKTDVKRIMNTVTVAYYS